MIGGSVIREMDDADGCDCIQPPLTPFLPTFTSAGLLSRLLSLMVLIRLLSTAEDDDNLGNEFASELSPLQSITSLMAATSVDVRRYRCRVSRIVGCCAVRWLVRFEGGEDLWKTKDVNIFVNFIC